MYIAANIAAYVMNMWSMSVYVILQNPMTGAGDLSGINKEFQLEAIRKIHRTLVSRLFPDLVFDLILGLAHGLNMPAPRP